MNTRIEIRPLRPFDKPKVIGCYLLLPIVATISIGFVISYWESIYKSFKYDKHSAPEVAYDTTEKAATANELLLQLSNQLRDFDKRSKVIFGIKHAWVIDGKKADTPTKIYDFVQKYQNKQFLKDYFDLAVMRTKLETKVLELESSVDNTVTSLGPSASSEKVFQTERLIRKNIVAQIDQLEVASQLLEQLGEIYIED